MNNFFNNLTFVRKSDLIQSVKDYAINHYNELKKVKGDTKEWKEYCELPKMIFDGQSDFIPFIFNGERCESVGVGQIEKMKYFKRLEFIAVKLKEEEKC